ncbi:conserved hypothetical protein [Nitrospira defluvii]|uniref:Uncharacterized protein n=1 Tax=Nitrospira defluvii TaxID=330214 RepID=A0ABM8QV75_9BACT|nr:conserved hypothetical protein [Nitrospira defluvii]
MPLKGAYFNGGLKTSQFHYNSGELWRSTRRRRPIEGSEFPHHGRLAPPHPLLLIMPH